MCVEVVLVLISVLAIVFPLLIATPYGGHITVGTLLLQAEEV